MIKIREIEAVRDVIITIARDFPYPSPKESIVNINENYVHECLRVNSIDYQKLLSMIEVVEHKIKTEKSEKSEIFNSRFEVLSDLKDKYLRDVAEIINVMVNNIDTELSTRVISYDDFLHFSSYDTVNSFLRISDIYKRQKVLLSLLEIIDYNSQIRKYEDC